MSKIDCPFCGEKPYSLAVHLRNEHNREEKAETENAPNRARVGGEKP